jgi:glycosyltransferase involved in cell wall biosynthesis
MKIALIGTRGVPARYGGFETAAEEIGSRLAERGHRVVVYCRNRGQTLRAYKGMELVNLPAVRRRVVETLSHSALSALHASRQQFDCAIVFNAANAPILPLLRVATAVHVDGLEWRRAKWEGRGARYLKWSERTAVRHADAVIADSRGIQDYLLATYRNESVFIPYGAPILDRADLPTPSGVGVVSRRFHLVVARLEPENSVEMILRAYGRSELEHPLVIVGDNPYSSPYVQRCVALVEGSDRVRWRGAVWDQRELDWYYANCLTYIHGHTVGGTNPSLLRAMGAGAAVVAKDVVFNREVCGAAGEFFADDRSLVSALRRHEGDPRAAEVRGESLRDRASSEYRWDEVAEAYESLCRNLVSKDSMR